MMAGCCMGRSAATQQLPAWLAGMQAAAGGAPTGVRLVLTAHTGNNLQCVRERGGHAQCANKNKGAWEILQLKQLGSGRGHYVLTSLHNGCNLQCRPDGAVSFANKNELQWEQWTIERQGDKWFFVSVHTGKVLQCDGRGQLRCANQNRKGREAFSLVVVDGGGPYLSPMERHIACSSENVFPQLGACEVLRMRLHAPSIPTNPQHRSEAT